MVNLSFIWGNMDDNKIQVKSKKSHELMHNLNYEHF